MSTRTDRALGGAVSGLVAILVGLSGLHVYWALGGEWGLGRALGGNEVPPVALIWLIAFFLGGATLVVLGRAGVWGHRLPMRLFASGTWALAGAFLLAAAVNFAGRTVLEKAAFAPFCVLLAILAAHVARAQPERTATALDAWLPAYSVGERHERVVDLPPEEALTAILALPVAPDRLVRTLFRLRGYGASTESIGEFTSKNGFVVLERTPTTYVFGIAARLRGELRQASDRESWLSWGAPGVKIVADFRAEPMGDAHSRLTTETRVLALDRWSRVLFRLYWLVVGPFSALIRRRWLRAILERTVAGTS